jgi:CheY-like chemotaxis protein
MTKNLLVKDNEMNRDILPGYLQLKGFEVLISVDGLEDVNRTRLERPDLILMGMSLPLNDEAASKLKDNTETQAAIELCGDEELSLETVEDYFKDIIVHSRQLFYALGAEACPLGNCNLTTRK